MAARSTSTAGQGSRKPPDSSVSPIRAPASRSTISQRTSLSSWRAPGEIRFRT